MPSFSDSIFLFILALLLFGPKKLPKLARELGKWVGEFRRASNEFKMQMEEELRVSEQADRQKEIAAMEAAAPLPPPLETSLDTAQTGTTPPEEPADSLPIAVSGELKIMPPATGLPSPRTPESSDALGGLLESIPMTAGDAAHSGAVAEPVLKESVLHGD